MIRPNQSMLAKRRSNRLLLRARALVVAASKVVILATTLTLASPSAAAALTSTGDGTWFWQSPQPVGDTLYSVCAVGAFDYWAVGDSGAVVHSADGGVTWSGLPTGRLDSFDAVAFADPLNGWIVGGGGYSRPSSRVVLRTTDGGLTWSEQSFPGVGAFHGVAFVDTQNGWIVGDNGIGFVTSDGGDTWQSRTLSANGDLACIAFGDAEHGIIGGPPGSLLRTTDGGSSWLTVTLPKLSTSEWSTMVVDAAFSDAVHGYALLGEIASVTVGDLIRTTDGGLTWQTVPIPGDEWVTALDVDDQGRPWIASLFNGQQRLRLRVSDDAGASWQTSTPSFRYYAEDIAVGSAGACAVSIGVLTSSDGVTWFARSSTVALLSAIDMVDTTTGWGLYRYGSQSPDESQVLTWGVMHTVDGFRWNEQSVLVSPTPWDYMDSPGRCRIDFADHQNGWAILSPSHLFATTDGGAQWQTTAIAGLSHVRDMQRFNVDLGWICGLKDIPKSYGHEGVLYGTSDGGDTWAASSLPVTFDPNDMEFVDDKNGWLVGRDGTQARVLHTSDGGAHWATQPTPAGAGSFDDIQFSDLLHGWIVGDWDDGESPTHLLLSTTDGGATWKLFSDPLPVPRPSAVAFADPLRGRLFGRGISRTTDGGTTWTTETRTGVGGPIAMVDFEHVWIGGCLSTVDGVGDSAPPATLDYADRHWHKLPYTVPLAAADIGGGNVVRTEYRLEEEASWHEAAGGALLDAPAGDHSLDGVSYVFYRSVDDSGNVEPAGACKVGIDTRRPVTTCPRSVSVRRGRIVYLPFRVKDVRGVPIDFRIELRRVGSRRVLKTLRGRILYLEGNQLVGYCGFRCRLSVGRYQFRVFATDEAGNRQAHVGFNVLTVLRP